MKVITLRLPAEQVQLVLDALGAMPHNRVRHVIDDIFRQATAETDEKDAARDPQDADH